MARCIGKIFWHIKPFLRFYNKTDSSSIVLNAIKRILDGADFKIPSMVAMKTVDVAHKIMEWSTTHSSTFPRFAIAFVCVLISCFNAKQKHLLVLSQDSIWQRFYTLCTSQNFTRKTDCSTIIS